MRVTNSMSPDRAVSGADGIGLKNVRERMAVQFEGRAALMAGPHGNEWITVITLPTVAQSPAMTRAALSGPKLHTATLLGTSCASPALLTRPPCCPPRPPPAMP